MGQVIAVRFRKPTRARKRGLALTLGAGPGYVFIAASGSRRYTIKQINALIRELREVRDDAKARAPK
jgi:hypothetical protein